MASALTASTIVIVHPSACNESIVALVMSTCFKVLKVGKATRTECTLVSRRCSLPS